MLRVRICPVQVRFFILVRERVLISPPLLLTQITYHDLETFNGDSSSASVYVLEPEFSLLNLQPGRNYSVSIRAVAKGIESAEKTTTVATREYSEQCHVKVDD